MYSFLFLSFFFFDFQKLCNAHFTNEMKRNFLIILSILALSYCLPSFFRLLSCSMLTLFEGSWSSPCWFVLFVHDRRSFQGHSSLMLPFGARAWGPELLVTLRKSIFSCQCWVPSWRLRVFDKSLLPHWDEVPCVFDVDEVPCVFDVVCFSLITGVARHFSFFSSLFYFLFFIFYVRVSVFPLLITRL